MSIDQQEAALALASIDAAGARSSQLQRYRRFAPFLMLWGCIWLLANIVSDLAPTWSGTAWLLMTVFGMATSIWLSLRSPAATAASATSSDRRDQGWRWLLSSLVIIAFQITVLIVLAPLDNRQQGTFAALLWTFLYMAVGVWAGWRLFTIGLTASLLIVLGYYTVNSHFFMYMGCVSGGALIAGGLWLRRL